MGKVKLPVTIIGIKYPRDVSKSKANLVILGRNFMENFETVTFNLKESWVKFDDKMVRNQNNRGIERVRIHQETVIPARTERIITVMCRAEVSMIKSVFLSKGILGHPGIYVANAMVIPN